VRDSFRCPKGIKLVADSILARVAMLRGDYERALQHTRAGLELRPGGSIHRGRLRLMEYSEVGLLVTLDRAAEARARFDQLGAKPPAEDLPEPLDDRMAVERDLITEERKRIVRAVLDELSPKERNVLRLLFLEEKNKAEVCRKMRISPDYLRVLLHRAKTSFRQKLACAPEKTGCA
jgi:RNA polymerase sigma factor (sigma-70 family)